LISKPKEGNGPVKAGAGGAEKRKVEEKGGAKKKGKK